MWMVSSSRVPDKVNYGRKIHNKRIQHVMMCVYMMSRYMMVTVVLSWHTMMWVVIVIAVA